MHRPNEATPLSMDKNKLMFPFFFFPIKACMLSPLAKLLYIQLLKQEKEKLAS
jgi:hypothetical protein